jgi:hypothetical protein
MSEHAWVLENVASFVAGGLDEAERERLVQHVRSCEECARAMRESTKVDETLQELFAPVRPGAALEDRLIRGWRSTPTRRSRFGKLGLATAAGISLAVVGAGFGALATNGDLVFPGDPNDKMPLRVFGETYQNTYSVVGPDQAVYETHIEESLGRNERSGAKHARAYRESGNAEIGKDPAQPLANHAPFGGAPKQRQSVDLTNEGIGLDPAQPLNYNVTRLEEVSVPGPVAPSDVNSRIAREKQSTSLAIPEDKTPLGRSTGGLGGGSIALGDDREKSKPSSAVPPPPGWGGPSGRGGRTVAREEVEKGGKSPTSAAGEYYSYRNEASSKMTSKIENKTVLRDELDRRSPTAPPPPNSPVSGRDNNDRSRKEDRAVAAAEPQKKAESKAPAEGQAKPAESAPAPKPDTKADTAPTVTTRKVIRSGEIEFEVESFDGAAAAVTKLVKATAGGFIATINSEKLPNGKVRGSIVVRIPPDQLDTLVLDLRRDLAKGGELKGLRLGSQDITKQYTDLESRLRAGRAMEERLLLIIKTGKGEIKDLLAAERELGVWRTRIEEIEGELRYYSAQVALSTLTIVLSEKEIRAAAAIVETERVQMGLEVEDVEKAFREAQATVTNAKGRVARSELKQQTAGQLNATLHFEVTPDNAGTVRDRLKQLGTVARLEIDRLEKSEGGSGHPLDAKIRRQDTMFQVSIYNLTNVMPRETVHLNLACVDAETAYKTLLARVEKATGRVVTSTLNRQRNDQTRGDVQFEVKTADAEAVLMDLRELGEVMRLQLTENPDTQNTTRSKRAFVVQLWALGSVAPREINMLQVACRDVPAAFRGLQEAVVKAKGRILNAQLNEQDRQNVTGVLDFEVRRTEDATVQAALTTAGDIYTRKVERAQDSETVVDSKVRYSTSLFNRDRVPPRENHTFSVEVSDVAQSTGVLQAAVAEAQGRTVESHVARQPNGHTTARLVIDVPAKAMATMQEAVRGVGTVRVQEATRNAQVPDGNLALARFAVTLTNAELIVPADQGIWHQVRRGLIWSVTALAWSLSWLVVGVCVVLPWALVIYVASRLFGRWRGPATASNSPA